MKRTFCLLLTTSKACSRIRGLFLGQGSVAQLGRLASGVRGQESGGGAGWIMSTKYPLGLRWFYCSNLFCLHLLGSYEGSFIEVFLI